MLRDVDVVTIDLGFLVAGLRMNHLNFWQCCTFYGSKIKSNIDLIMNGTKIDLNLYVAFGGCRRTGTPFGWSPCTLTWSYI